MMLARIPDRLCACTGTAAVYLGNATVYISECPAIEHHAVCVYVCTVCAGCCIAQRHSSCQLSMFAAAQKFDGVVDQAAQAFSANRMVVSALSCARTMAHPAQHTSQMSLL